MPVFKIVRSGKGRGGEERRGAEVEKEKRGGRHVEEIRLPSGHKLCMYSAAAGRASGVL